MHTTTAHSPARRGFFAALLVTLLALALGLAPQLLAQTSGPEPPASPLLSWLWSGLGVGLCWLLLYKGLYPVLLRSYRAATAQRFVWILFFLYGLSWLHLATYVFFDYGFYFLWIRWVAVFLAALFLIWFVLAFLRRVRT